MYAWHQPPFVLCLVETGAMAFCVCRLARRRLSPPAAPVMARHRPGDDARQAPLTGGFKRPQLTTLFTIPIVVLLVLAHTAAGVAAPPERIISLGPINTENVFLLGAGDRLVGSTTYCVRPEEAKKTAKIGSVMQVSIERILSLKPDLVLATGLTPEHQVQALSRLGLKVVRFDQPRSFAESCAHFDELGRLLGLAPEAGMITAELGRKVDEIRARVTAYPHPRPRVLLQIGASPLYVSGIDSFTHDFISLLGADNVMGDQPSGRINYEQAIAADPDVILIGIMGSEGGIAAREKERWLKFTVIRAASNHRIHVVDPDLVCSPSPATFVEALLQIEPLLYPGREL